MSKVQMIRVLGRGRIGRRGVKYVLYLDRYASQLLMPYANARARVYMSDGPNNLAAYGTLSIAREFKPPRIAIFLPMAMNPTWERLCDRELMVTIEVQEGEGARAATGVVGA